MILLRSLGLLNPVKVARQITHGFGTARETAAEAGVSPMRITIEQALLYFRNNLSRCEYYMYGLYRPELSWEEKTAFIADRDSRRYWEVLTPFKYASVFKNKLLFDRLCRGAALPVPRFYGLFDPVSGRADDGTPLRNGKDIARLIQNAGLTDVVMKPLEGSKGLSVLPLRIEQGRFVSMAGRDYTPDELAQRLASEEMLSRTYPGQGRPPRGFVFQERLQNHPEMSDLVGTTLLSIRFTTFLDLRGDIEILTGILKLPGRDCGVDNLSQGALAVHVDLETGALGEGRFYQRAPCRSFRTHPESGVPFFGRKLPLWKEACELALRAAAAFPMVHVLGWDIAITPDGPTIIEANSSWAPDFAQLTTRRGLMQGRFKETYLALRSRRNGRKANGSSKPGGNADSGTLS